MIWTKNGNGNWDFGNGWQLGVPDTFCRIAIEEERYCYDIKYVRYTVVVIGTDDYGCSKDFTLKRFKSRKHAQAFADKLAEMLNEQED